MTSPNSEPRPSDTGLIVPAVGIASTSIALAAAYRLNTARLAAQLAQAMARLWDSLGNWRQETLPEFVGQAVPLVGSYQQAMHSLTTGYLSAQRTAQTGRGIASFPRPSGSTGEATRGVDPIEVYARPHKTVWFQISKGADWADAVAAGRLRANAIAGTDLQLTKFKATNQTLSGERPERQAEAWMRVPSQTACALCLIASTQRYHTKVLAKIHNNCKCDVMPLWFGPGRHVINRDLLDAVHAAVAEHFGVSFLQATELDYRKIMLTRTHGELGDVLTYAGHHFRSPDELVRARPTPLVQQIRAELGGQ